MIEKSLKKTILLNIKSCLKLFVSFVVFSQKTLINLLYEKNMADVIYLARANLMKFQSLNSKFLSEISVSKTVIGKSKIQQWLKELTKCITEGISEITPITETPTNSLSNTVLDSQESDEMTVQLDINTTAEDSNEVQTITIEERVKNIEILVQNLIKPKNVNKSHVNNTFSSQRKQNPKVFRNTNNDKNSKKCWICDKLGHLSYNCYYKKQNQSNGYQKNGYKKNGFQRNHINNYHTNRSQSFLAEPNTQQTGPPLQRTVLIPVPQQTYATYHQNYPIDGQYHQLYQTNQQNVRN